MQDFVLQANDLEILIRTIRAEGYRLLGPVARDKLTNCDEIASVSDLQAGGKDSQSPEFYRKTEPYFVQSAGLQAWTRLLQSPWRKVSRSKNSGVSITEIVDDPQPLAVLGIRSCELHAITDSNSGIADPRYREGQQAHCHRDFFAVSINCSAPPSSKTSCICAQVGAEPEMSPPGDLVMTEVFDRQDHYFLIGSDSYRGDQILQQLPVTPASEYHLELARKTAQPVVTGLRSGVAGYQ